MGLGFSRERKESEYDGKIHPFRHWKEDESQNQKDAQELEQQQIKTKILSIEKTELRLKLEALQSQHNKLVDAIQRQIEASAKNELAFQNSKITERELRTILQNLLKESEKE